MPDADLLSELVEAALEEATPLGAADGATVYRWQDPSGARLILTAGPHSILDLLPSYAGAPGALLTDLRRANPEVTTATVVDTTGETLTKLAVELEERRLSASAVSGPLPASIIALGVDITVQTDEDAFSTSDASLLDPDDATRQAPEDPPHQHIAWPPRMAAESLLSYGVFGPPGQAQAYARLHGTVLTAELRTVTLTGHHFIPARVHTLGFELDLCMPATPTTPVPKPGNIIGGEVLLIASVPALIQT